MECPDTQFVSIVEAKYTSITVPNCNSVDVMGHSAITACQDASSSCEIDHYNDMSGVCNFGNDDNRCLLIRYYCAQQLEANTYVGDFVITPPYIISFDMRILGTSSGWSMILHFGAVNTERYPALFIYPSSTKLYLELGTVCANLHIRSVT